MSEDLDDLLNKAWQLHHAECLWSLNEEAVKDPGNAAIVARSLRNGGLNAWALGRRIEQCIGSLGECQ